MKIPKNPKILMLDFPVAPKFLYDEEILKIIKIKKASQALIDYKNGVFKIKRKLKKSFTTGLLTIGNYLKNHGYAIEYDIIVSDLTPAHKSKIISSDVILLTAMTPIYPYVRKIAREIKRINGNKIIILGGYHASALPKEVLIEEKSFDIIVFGEGEKPLLNLLKRGTDYAGLPGIAMKQDDTVVIGPPGDQLINSEIPSPDYSLLPGNPLDYRYNIQMIRGCPNRCNYCVNGYFWKTVRRRPLNSILNELKYFGNILGKDAEIHITDNILTLNISWLKELVKAYESSGLSLEFTADVKAEFLDLERIRLIKRLGVKKVYIGFEDAENKILNKVNRIGKLEENIKAIKEIRNHSDIKVEAYWMIGLPGTNRETIKKNILITTELIRKGLLQSICLDVVFVPLPGTPLFDEAEKFGIKILHKNWENYHRTQFWPVYECESASRNQLRKYFIDFEKAITKAYLEKLGLSVDEVILNYKKLISAIKIDLKKCCLN